MPDVPIEYEIDKGVPVPVVTSRVIPVRRLEVGDSLRFPIEKRATIQSFASRLKKLEGREFTVKKINDTECRIWRLK